MHVARTLVPLFGLVGWVYWPTLRELHDAWTTHPEYSHGLLVPFFAGYLALNRERVPGVATPWPWIGFATLVVAGFARLGGSAISFLPLEGVSLVGTLFGLTMLAGGRASLRRYWPPLVFLLFMIPLPYEASRLLGGELQKVATAASTFLLQCCGEPAVAEGNRILIGSVTLNVVEACSGLRMLVTFAAFSTAAVFLMRRHWVVKGIVLASAVPIAVLTNVLRIVATGLLHVHLADGPDKARTLEFLHDFNGWMMMPVGLLLLLVELWVLKHLLVEGQPATRGPRPTGRTLSAKFPRVIRLP